MRITEEKHSWGRGGRCGAISPDKASDLWDRTSLQDAAMVKGGVASFYWNGKTLGILQLDRKWGKKGFSNLLPGGLRSQSNTAFLPYLLPLSLGVRTYQTYQDAHCPPPTISHDALHLWCSCSSCPSIWNALPLPHCFLRSFYSPSKSHAICHHLSEISFLMSSFYLTKSESSSSSSMFW